MFEYIARHWRGEFSLPQSYWLNGALVLAPFNLYLRFTGEAFDASPPESPATYVFRYLLPFLVYLPVVVWSGVGIWRSAGRRIADDRLGWAWVARGIVLLNLITVAGSIAVTARNDYALVAAYFEERDATFRVTDRGTYVLFHGVITEESANALAPLLTEPRVKRLILDGSNGGFVAPTLRLAKLIHDRDLFVVAIGHCESSCTVLFAAGAIRGVDPKKTQLGFHLATLPGINDSTPDWNEAERYYKDAGMSAALIAKIDTHRGQHDIYRPSLRELIDDGFVTQVYVETPEKGFLPAHEWCDETPACKGSIARNDDASRSEGAHHGP